ncbi:hypothetical protein BV22DRAFT_1046828 [Leucogyrophana mollusca]|uniref:Uncharacterized protein n=1 Tax=Leucogyrophana mollusca TaxID=85980 RepID=A0ACB8BHY1_9AGAM|nr:hypothetical protein BV22DRAFT_1046828 [Leucogyrophana mollusca]
MSRSASGGSNAHPELRMLYFRLQSVQRAMDLYEPMLPRPPIIDASVEGSTRDEENAGSRDSIPGLRFLREEVRRELEVLKKFLEDNSVASLPPISTNAPYLTAVWLELSCARTPVAIYRTFFPKDSKKSRPLRKGDGSSNRGVKVDVVAHSGRHWIRVNTTSIKNSRLLAEFRELDSYLTSEDEDGDGGQDKRPSLAQKEFDNSVLRMGRALLSTAKDNPISTSGDIPQVTMRLTRLDPSPANEAGEEIDSRIAKTVSCLRDMGIDVQLGEREDNQLLSMAPQPSPIPFRPTRHINLDLSSLIALVSDITHSALPTTSDEARIRFIPSQKYLEWKKERVRLLGTKGEHSSLTESGASETWADSGKHSRALSNQALQEMQKGLLQDMHDRLAAHYPSLQGVEFWTTQEARHRCLQIVSKIGGQQERKRADALLSSHICSQQPPLHSAEEQYWEHSRYPRGFLPLIPIQLFSSTEADEFPLPRRPSETPTSSPFFELVAQTCRIVLSHDAATLRAFCTVQPRLEQTSDGAPYVISSSTEQDIPPATVTSANPKLTVHTIQSMLWGASYGWTTLTANRSSVKALLKEAKIEETFTYNRERVGKGRDGGSENAAIWMVEPRSLAEGMRSDSDG